MSVNICLKRLSELENPLGEQSAWGGPVTEACVLKALSDQRFESQPGGNDHAARIAYLVLNPAGDPIHLDVGIPSYTELEWPIQDGNHRVPAAIYRRDTSILADIEGSLDHIVELFGLTEAELDEL